jgi:predicted transcriptional regulator
MNEKELERTEVFLDLYRQLEREARNIYFPEISDKQPVIGLLMSLPTVREFKDDIEYCRVVRNFLVHTPKVSGMYPIIPSDEMINILQKCLNRIKSPISAMDYCIKAVNMYTASLDTSITEVSSYMNSHGFTHVPIMDRQNLVGIFSDNVLYSYICEKNSITINSDTKMEAVKEYLPLENHLNEYFAFLPKEASLYEASKLFTIDVRSMKKLTVIFFTNTGKKTEKILGMMTPYSLLRDMPNHGLHFNDINI